MVKSARGVSDKLRQADNVDWIELGASTDFWRVGRVDRGDWGKNGGLEGRGRNSAGETVERRDGGEISVLLCWVAVAVADSVNKNQTVIVL